MRNRALLVFTVCNVFPEFLHTSAVWSYRTLAGGILTTGSMSEKKQTLLLVPNLLPL